MPTHIKMDMTMHMLESRYSDSPKMAKGSTTKTSTNNRVLLEMSKLATRL